MPSVGLRRFLPSGQVRDSRPTVGYTKLPVGRLRVRPQLRLADEHYMTYFDGNELPRGKPTGYRPIKAVLIDLHVSSDILCPYLVS